METPKDQNRKFTFNEHVIVLMPFLFAFCVFGQAYKMGHSRKWFYRLFFSLKYLQYKINKCPLYKYFAYLFALELQPRTTFAMSTNTASANRNSLRHQSSSLHLSQRTKRNQHLLFTRTWSHAVFLSIAPHFPLPTRGHRK